MKFTQTLWEENTATYEQIVALPFNQELTNGTLDTNKFKFYVNQDAHYLAEYGRALSIMAAKSPDTKLVLDFIKFAEGAIVTEQLLHGSYFEQFDFELSGSKSPTCLNYTNFLLATCSLKSLEEGMAALLPCFWIYREVGLHILGNTAKDNPFQAWIDTYSGEEFADAVEKAIAITDKLAEEASPTLRAKMKEAFTMSCKMEYLFWESAYRQEAWVI
ncbi:thiaminase II [Limibacter armeniacum]|uniref:thiaminase II n=1 Tax=Limibacter armeniacum TaxID=466084 RepID=UPI002FE5D906